MNLDEKMIQQVVASVLERLVSGGVVSGEPPTTASTSHHSPITTYHSPLTNLHGVFATVDEAVGFARQAQSELTGLGLEARASIITAMRNSAFDHADELAKMAYEEAGIGRYEHKVIKNQMAAHKSPGVEDLVIDSVRGDAGLTITDYLPFGVIAAIAPITNPTSTIINNGIIMIAAGNTVVFCPHPSTTRCTLTTISILNDAIVAAGGPRNCMTSVAEPSIRHAQETMQHRGVDLIVATGGPAVVRAALEQHKRAMCAGPGNPPVVVDETADIAKAAQDIVAGAGFDNCLPCIGEKSCLVVESVADDFIRELKRSGAFEVTGNHARRLGQLIMPKHGDHYEMNRALVGKNADVILKEAGLAVSGDPPIAFFETDRQDPCVLEEQLMPILPLVRVRNFDEAVYVAQAAEGGRGHTVIIHSRNMERVTRLRAAIPCTVFVVNGPSAAGDGVGGEGFLAMTVAGHTGEGFTRPRTFVKERRLALAGFLAAGA